MYLKYATVQISRLRTFRAPDPWNNGQICDWNLNYYGIATAISADRDLAELTQSPNFDRVQCESLGIQAQPNGRYHILPGSLGELSRDRQVADEELPALLHRIEPQLEDLDFKHPHDWLFAFYAGFTGLLLIGSFILLCASPNEIKLAIGCIAFFGFFATIAFGRMVRRSRRKQRQKTELWAAGKEAA